MSATDPLEIGRLVDVLASREALSTEPEDTHDLPQLLPLSHDNPFLSAADFDVEEFLLSRSHTSLPDLRSELREYLAFLKEELVELINNDYEAFISLSTDLQEEGDRLERMKHPSVEMNNAILEARSRLQYIQSSIKEKLERRSAVRDEKALLHLLLKISDSISRLESLLLINSPSDGLSPEDARLPAKNLQINDELGEKEKGSRSRHLLRIATEYNQLLYLAQRAEGCAFVSEMQWRIERIKSTLASDLEYSFKAILNSLIVVISVHSKATKAHDPRQSAHNPELTDALRTYDMLCLWRDAEDIIRQETIRSFVKKTIFPGCLSAFPSGQDTSRDIGKANVPFSIETDGSLGKLYAELLSFIKGAPKLIMDTAEQISSATAKKPRAQDTEETENGEDNRFDILANVIWVEVSRAIMDELGSSVFAVGKPDDFRKNFEITQRFMFSLEQLAPSVVSVRKLRRHPSYDAFRRRWQRPVYFQLRWKDIVIKVEDALESKTLSILFNTDLKSNGLVFRLSQSIVVWDAICQCWSDEIYLSELGYRFWKLTLQLLKRYQSWLEGVMPPFRSFSHMISPVMDKSSGLVTPASRSSTPIPNLEAQSNDQTLDDDRLLRQCSVVIQDIKEMENAVRALWDEKISKMLPRIVSSEEAIETPEATIRSSLRSLSSLIPALLSQVETILVQRCCEALAPVKSLPGQFRATTQRNVPSKPSNYVPLILRPVKSFFGMNTGEIEMKTLKEAFCSPLSTSVVESVATRYSSHISGMRKTEESLKRLRMGKRSGFSLFSGSGNNTEDDNRDDGRVRAQLILDVEAFSKEAQSFGVDLEHSAALKALNFMVHSNIPEVEVS